MLHAKGVCIANVLGGNHSWFPLCFFNRTIPKQISEVFSVKCDIKANASATQDFSPKPIANVRKVFETTKKSARKLDSFTSDFILILKFTVYYSSDDAVDNLIKIGLTQKTIVSSYNIIAVELTNYMCNKIGLLG